MGSVVLGCFGSCGKHFQLFLVFFPAVYLVKSSMLPISHWTWRNTPPHPPRCHAFPSAPFLPGADASAGARLIFLRCMRIDRILVKLFITNKQARCWGLAPWLLLPQRLLPAVGSGSSRGRAAQRREQKRPLPPRGAEDSEQKVHVPLRSLFSSFSFFPPLSRSPFFSPALRWRFKQFFFWLKFLHAATRN